MLQGAVPLDPSPEEVQMAGRNARIAHDGIKGLVLNDRAAELEVSEEEHNQNPFSINQ